MAVSMYLTYLDHFQAKETLSRPFKAIKAKAKAVAKVNRFWVVCTNLEQLVVFKITSNFFWVSSSNYTAVFFSLLLLLQ